MQKRGVHIWDAVYNRLCTWVLLETDKKERQFMVFNTHFDHKGVKARTESAKLILRKIKELNKSNLPIILTGDFNLTPEQTPIAFLTSELKDPRSISKEKPYGPSGTFNNFDFIFLSTGGGPVDATQVLPVYIYIRAWHYFAMGYASSIGIVMLVLLLIFSLAYMRVTREPEVS